MMSEVSDEPKTEENRKAWLSRCRRLTWAVIVVCRGVAGPAFVATVAANHLLDAPAHPDRGEVHR